MARDDRLLAPLVAHARARLAELDADDVPPALDRVVAYTGPRLPPPLVARLLDEIDTNDWLRGRLAESWEGSASDAASEESEADPPAGPSTLFLRRPPGWERRFASALADASASAAMRRADELSKRSTALRAELAETKRRLKRAQRDAETAVADAQREAQKKVAAARSQAAGGDASGVLMRRIELLQSSLEEAARDLEDSRDRVRHLRSELLKARRVRRPERAPSAPSAWSALDVDARAALLDDIQRAFRPPVDFETDGPWRADADAPALVLPAGARPDTSDAIKWLIEVERRYVLIVDGYNVVHLMGTPVDARIRVRLNRDLARLRMLAAAPVRVIVVYDSARAADVTATPGPGGIEVRFTADGHSADDEILYLATQLGTSAVVVSSDRQVREGAERVGALGLWSEALVEWIRTA
jgi:predicted RNA-binding protein with PIN domain